MRDKQDKTGREARTSAALLAGVERDVTSVRTDLIHRVTENAFVVALPIFAVAAYALYRTERLALLPLALLALALIAGARWVSGDASAAAVRRRAWLFSAGIAVAGIGVELAVGGIADARIVLLAAVWATALLLGRPADLWMLGLSSLGLLTFVLMEVSGLFVPSSTPGIELGWGLLLSRWALFLLVGWASLAIWYYVVQSHQRLLDESHRLTRSLKGEIAGLDQRVVVLQDVNTSLQRRVVFLEASLTVIQALSTIFDLGPLLNRATELIAENFSFYHVGLYLMDEHKEWLVLQAASSTVGKELVLHGHRLRYGGKTVIGAVAARRESHLATYTTEPQPESKAAILSPTRSSLTLPLVMGETLVGVLDLQSSDVAAFEDDDRRTLAGLATYLALAIDNVRRLNDEAAILEAASPFYRTANQLATARTEKDVYRIIGETARKFNPSRLLVMRSSGEGERLQIVVDMQGEHIALVEQDVARLALPSLIDVIIMGFVLDAPLWVEDLANLDSSLSPELASALSGLEESSDIAALAFLPIRGDETTDGGVLILYRALHRFVPMERRLHRLLTELGGAALVRSRLLMAARTRLDLEQRLAAVGERLHGSFDPDVILQTTVRELGMILDADLITIEVDPSRGVEPEGGIEHDGAR